MKYILTLCLVSMMQWGATAQTVKTIKLDELKKMMSEKPERVKVINFWATWCKPCVQELPDFEKAREKYAGKNVDFYLVSLDFANQLETKVAPFVAKKGLKSTVVLLDEPDYDKWIGQIEASWGGNIPITLVINPKKNKRKFIGAETTLEELSAAIDQSF